MSFLLKSELLRVELDAHEVAAGRRRERDGVVTSFELVLLVLGEAWVVDHLDDKGLDELEPDVVEDGREGGFVVEGRRGHGDEEEVRTMGNRKVVVWLCVGE